MEQQLERLSVILKVIPASYFYNITITEYGINLQGKFHGDLVKIALNNKFKECGMSANGHAKFKRLEIEITLT